MSKSGTQARLMDIADALENVSGVTHVHIKESFRGVPHLIGELPTGTRFSVAWFWIKRSYRIFWPYPATKQKKVYASRVETIIELVHDLIEEKV